MKPLNKDNFVEEIKEGACLVIFTKENCSNCKAVKEEMGDSKDVKVFEYPCDPKIPDSILDQYIPQEYIFPIVYSFYNGAAVRGTTGYRNKSQLENGAFLTLVDLKMSAADVFVRNRKLENAVMSELDNFLVPKPPVPVEVKQPAVMPPEGEPLANIGCAGCSD